jgi:F-type H+-transporting ATPase subunit a
MEIWRDIAYASGIVGFLSLVAWRVSSKVALIPGRLQSVSELFAAGADDFVCGILGPKGRRYTPFIGTLFIYILFMNLLGLVPFMKSPTASWSTTLGLALCVFVYVQYSAVRELGFLGYLDHLMGKPRGILAFSLVLPLLMLLIHIVGELVKPLSLSLRLRSNIWGDEMLMEIVAGFGLKGIPLLFFNTLIAITKGVIQAFVFGLLTTVYFAIYLVHEE